MAPKNPNEIVHCHISRQPDQCSRLSSQNACEIIGVLLSGKIRSSHTKVLVEYNKIYKTRADAGRSPRPSASSSTGPKPRDRGAWCTPSDQRRHDASFVE